jgi:hypothetical protein
MPCNHRFIVDKDTPTGYNRCVYCGNTYRIGSMVNYDNENSKTEKQESRRGRPPKQK